jgi:nucleotide-binding universal stress UspA family protein
MFETILVPTDGSDCADLALDHVADIARRYDATVHVLHVLDVRDLEKAPDVEPFEDDAAALIEAAESGIDADVGTVTSVSTGYPDQEIRDYADQIEADMIAMGSHGRTGVRRSVLGSIAEKVLRLSDVPVLTVTESEVGTLPHENVLVPTDGSRGADAAVDPAASLATAYDATVHGLSVVDTRALGADVRSDVLVDSLEDNARTALDDLEVDLVDRDVDEVRKEVMFGMPYQSIQNYVEDNAVDLVVMGTHGRTGLDRYLLGSVTEKLVRTSPVPVLSVRIPEDE